MRCEEALRRLAEYLDGELSRQEHSDLEQHLRACRGCYSRAEFERQLKRHLAGLGRRAPDPDFADRLRALVQRFTHGVGGTPHAQ